MQWYVAAYYSFYTILISCRMCHWSLAGQINNNQSEDHFRQLEISTVRQRLAYFNEIQEIKEEVSYHISERLITEIFALKQPLLMLVWISRMRPIEGIRRFIYHVKPQ